MSTPPRPIPVVCALIERGGRILLARRPAHKPPALKWEFPGGKVQAGETPAAALRREIREELACRIVVGRALPRVVPAGDGASIELIPFVCRLAAGSSEPAPVEHGEIRWVGPADLLRYDLAAPDRPVARAYRRRPAARGPAAAPRAHPVARAHSRPTAR